MFTRILDESGIIRRELFLKDDERALTNYLHIFEILLEELVPIGRDLADLVATLTAYIQRTRKPPGEDGNVQRLESDRAAVQIMTIHKSKGLEAAVVFLYGGFSRFRGSGTHEYHEAKAARALHRRQRRGQEEGGRGSLSGGAAAVLRGADPGQGTALLAPGARQTLGQEMGRRLTGAFNERLQRRGKRSRRVSTSNISFELSEFRDRLLQPAARRPGQS